MEFCNFCSRHIDTDYDVEGEYENAEMVGISEYRCSRCCEERDTELELAVVPNLTDALAKLCSEVEGVLAIDSDSPLAEAYTEAKALLAKVSP